jgi:hypothetical protein
VGRTGTCTLLVMLALARTYFDPPGLGRALGFSRLRRNGFRFADLPLLGWRPLPGLRLVASLRLRRLRLHPSLKYFDPPGLGSEVGLKVKRGDLCPPLECVGLGDCCIEHLN